jgi:serine protease Do
MGVVSSVARQLRTGDPMIYIQTDAPINPGNSGGPLVDTSGMVVGINTLILSKSGGSEGLGFAAPSNIVKNVFEQIKNTGRVRRGAIGVHTQTITPLLATGLGLQTDGQVIITDVIKNGPGDRGGLLPGDVILELDGKTMENSRQFEVNLYQKKIGKNVKLLIQRESNTRLREVTVIERPDDLNRFFDMVIPEQNLIPGLGLLALDLNDLIIKLIPELKSSTGVVVANKPNLNYEQDSLQPGDVIHAINGKTIETLSELKKAFTKLKSHQPVVLQIERFGILRYISFEMDEPGFP